jgi:hypothetical protein
MDTFLLITAILFEKAIILGTENDCLSYTSGGPLSPDGSGAMYSLFPFCILQRTVIQFCISHVWA